MMRVIVKRLWTEPVYVYAVVSSTITAALFLPDWKAALASIAVLLGGGKVVRGRVTPTG